MEFRQLRHFVGVVDEGNVSRAALNLHISQPALTRSIRNLEDELGTDLLERRSRGVEPTEVGRTFYRHARLILSECDRAKNDVAANAGAISGHVAFGIGAMFDTTVTDTAIAKLTAKHPHTQVTVLEGYFEDLMPLLDQGQIEFVFSNFPLLPIPERFVTEPLGSIESHVVAQSDHPLTRKRALSKQQLAAARWAVIKQPHAIDALDALFIGDNLAAPAHTVETNSLPLINMLVCRHGFLSMLPNHLVADRLKAKELNILDVAGTPIMRNFGFICRRQTGNRDLVNELQAEIRQACRGGLLGLVLE